MDEPADAVMLECGFGIVFWKGVAAIRSKWFRI